MKKTLCTLLFAAFLVVFFAPSGRAGEYESALKTAKGENKPVILYFFSKSCYYCTLMDKETLANSEVAGMIKRNFVFLRVDVDKSPDLSQLYRVGGTPSSWFLDASGKRVFEAPGFIKEPLYKKLLQFVKGGHYKNTDIQTYLNKTSAAR